MRAEIPLGVVAAIHAAVFGASAIGLPLETSTPLVAAFSALAILHLVLAVLAVNRSERLAPFWRLVSWTSLGCFVAVTVVVFDAATYLASLYGSLGERVG